MMLRYKEYFLEYHKNNNEVTNPRIINGKNPYIDPSERKNGNIIKKEYKHKHPVVDSITSGRANNVSLKGLPLEALLKTYNTHFEQGTKVLGNSDVEAELYEDEEGIPCAILKRRKTNVV